MKCCHDLCGFDAFCKVQTPTGWANFCHQHYDEYFKRKADAYCAELGLSTPAQKLQWLRDNWRKTIKRVSEREPGSDDEVIAA